jgi:hypothetical protein
MEKLAVEFLVEKLKSQGLLIGEPDNLVAVREAKEMEKKQIENAFCDGVDDEYEYHINSQPRTNLEQYYNETYNLSQQDKP